MDDNILSTAYCLKGFADKLFTRLHQNLYGYVIRNVSAFNQGTQNFVLCFRSGRKANLDFLKAAIYQGVEKRIFSGMPIGVTNAWLPSRKSTLHHTGALVIVLSAIDGR